MIANQRYELVALDQLRPHPDNPRRGDVETIAESITHHGFVGAVIAQQGTGHILAGNHRWKAAKGLGEKKLPVLWLDVDDAQARKILLADNRTADMATYDESALLSLLEDIGADAEALSGSAFTVDDLEDLAARVGVVETAPPSDVRPAYAETEEEAAARAEQLGAASQGKEETTPLREFIVVLEVDDHDQAVKRLNELRRELGEEVASGDLVLAALRTATVKNLRRHLPNREADAA